MYIAASGSTGCSLLLQTLMFTCLFGATEISVMDKGTTVNRNGAQMSGGKNN